MGNSPDALVICSTLNQITNYLVIKKYTPDIIYNITFSEEVYEKINKNMKIKDWNDQLKDTCENYEFRDISLKESDFYNIKDIIRKIKTQINEDDERIIYWHITGGQRIVAMAAAEFIKNRSQDKWVYMEGNVEKLLEYDNQLKEMKDYNYDNKELEFKDVFKLAGFNFNEKLESMTILDINKELRDIKLQNEMMFYNKLYNILLQKDEPFREILLTSNMENNSKDRKEKIEEGFRKIIVQNKELEEKEYDIFNSKELKYSYPAGYILEKLAAYKIYNILKSKKLHCNINQIGLSLKIYFNAKEDKKTVDELDIVLLSSTGKIINFECKVGGMEGDNAKSHNYTTYRLSGVFGMPILISPLFKEEIDNKLKVESYGKQYSAIRAAENAELYIWGIDEIEKELKELLKIRLEEE